MRFKIEAGAEIDVLTEKEFKDGLAAWMMEARRGVKFRKATATAQKAAAVWAFDPNSQGQSPNSGAIAKLGPAEGFLWSVTSISVSGSALVAGTDLYAVYDDEISGTRLIRQGQATDIGFNIGDLVLDGGASLVFSGAATGAGNDVYISVRAAEVPTQLAHLFL